MLQGNKSILFQTFSDVHMLSNVPVAVQRKQIWFSKVTFRVWTYLFLNRKQKKSWNQSYLNCIAYMFSLHV